MEASLAQVMIYRLFSIKPLPSSMGTIPDMLKRKNTLSKLRLSVQVCDFHGKNTAAKPFYAYTVNIYIGKIVYLYWTGLRVSFTYHRYEIIFK